MTKVRLAECLNMYTMMIHDAPTFLRGTGQRLSLILLIYPARNCQILAAVSFGSEAPFAQLRPLAQGWVSYGNAVARQQRSTWFSKEIAKGPEHGRFGDDGRDTRLGLKICQSFSSVFITIQDGRWSHCSCIPWPWTGCQPIPASLHRIYIRNTQDCPRVIRVKQSTENKANVANPLLKPIKLLTTCWI